MNDFLTRKDEEPDYDYVSTKKLQGGEKYAYVYRRSKVDSIKKFEYDDKKNAFLRPPFCVRYVVRSLTGMNDLQGPGSVHVSFDFYFEAEF